MTLLIIINDPPYGTEKAYNALRLAMAVQKNHPETRVRVFLMADSVGCAVAGQITPDGYYNLERMLKSILLKGGQVSLCGSCVDARGLAQVPWIDGINRGTMDLLAEWTLEADKTVVF